MFTRLAKGVVYTGIDPTGKRAFLRCLVEEMTREQLAAWFAIDPATASRYVIPASLVDAIIDAPIIDNEPDKPVPKLDNNAKRKQGK